MHVQDYTGDKDVLLDAAFSSPKLHPKKQPTIDTAMRVVGDTVTKHAKKAIAAEVCIDLMDKIAMYEIANGEYEDLDGVSASHSDYESGMDDAVEAALERWDDYLSADWLGRNTVDTQVWLSTDADRSIVDKLAESAAKEVFKQLTANKTPAQVLSSAGIVQADVEGRLASHIKTKRENSMTTTEPDITGVVAKIKAYVGKGFDQMAVYEDLETLVEETDEILAGSAASRLGINAEDVEVLLLAALDMEDPASDLLELVTAHKEPSKRTTAKAKKEAKARTKAEEAANGLEPSVFQALKGCGAGDTAMAEALGVSRSTYTNYVKGKTHLVPDEDQYAALRKELVERSNMLLAGLAALDGTEPQQVA